MRLPALVALILACGTAFACEAPGGAYQRLESERFVVWLVSEPVHPGVGAEFSLDVKLCARDGVAPRSIQVDAWMPAHRHGMNTRAAVRPLAPHRYRVDGLLFHMPGRWAIRFEIDTAEGRERLSLEQDVE